MLIGSLLHICLLLKFSNNGHNSLELRLTKISFWEGAVFYQWHCLELPAHGDNKSTSTCSPFQPCLSTPCRPHAHYFLNLGPREAQSCRGSASASCQTLRLCCSLCTKVLFSRVQAPSHLPCTWTLRENGVGSRQRARAGDAVDPNPHNHKVEMDTLSVSPWVTVQWGRRLQVVL